jgi:hypothetical protein
MLGHLLWIYRKIAICRDKLIANVVGAGLAPPENKISNSNTGRPRPTPTMLKYI